MLFGYIEGLMISQSPNLIKGMFDTRTKDNCYSSLRSKL
jgi:hypothetical protein